ncbi:MAG: SGNH/GDSL hydrolase family protein, partial [Candidatus Ratteibacteria bacterium]|nr:SGNH/GDSL hydrolase family protein [Candidatus Ratteibacteria bacterium]
FSDINDGTDGVNGGDSSMVLKYLWAVKEKNIYHPDYILLNCGIHDIKRNAISKTYQVPPKEYEKNLREINSVVREMGAYLIWVRTTPVKEKTGIHDELKTVRYNSDVVLYNNIADRVMRKLKVPVIDLYTFTLNLGEDVFIDNVHPDEKTAELQAAFISGWLDCFDLP